MSGWRIEDRPNIGGYFKEHSSSRDTGAGILLPGGCKRLAQRAIVGLARTGGHGLDGSSDLFLAFSTGNHLLRSGELCLQKLEMVPLFSMDDLIIATVEAVEEAILNALIVAQTIVGRDGHTAYAIPHDLLLKAMRKEG